MKISDVRVRIVKKDDSKLKAVASVTFDDCFVVHDIKVIEGTESCFIAMPSRKTADGEYKDIAHPIKTEMREELIKVILASYEEEKAKPQENQSTTFLKKQKDLAVARSFVFYFFITAQDCNQKPNCFYFLFLRDLFLLPQ